MRERLGKSFEREREQKKREKKNNHRKKRICYKYSFFKK